MAKNVEDLKVKTFVEKNASETENLKEKIF